MQDILKYGLSLSPSPASNKFEYIDGWQKIFNAFIMSSYFPWVCLILIINGRNWKKPVILILIGNWFFRGIGDILMASMDVRPHEPDTYWPFSRINWYVGYTFAHVFWFLGEIIGDWYPLMRTKIVTNNKKKMIWVYITCIFYNFTKVLAMFCGFINFPINLKVTDEKAVTTDDINEYNIAWWSIIALMHFASCLYDLSIIITLNSSLPKSITKIDNYRKIGFLEKFKKISEFRIIFSMLASLIFLPFVTTFVIFLILDFRSENSKYIQKSDAEIEQLRIAVLNFNYALMYMDQILLRYYMGRSKKGSSSGRSMGSTTLGASMGSTIGRSIGSIMERSLGRSMKSTLDRYNSEYISYNSKFNNSTETLFKESQSQQYISDKNSIMTYYYSENSNNDYYSQKSLSYSIDDKPILQNSNINISYSSIPRSSDIFFSINNENKKDSSFYFQLIVLLLFTLLISFVLNLKVLI